MKGISLDCYPVHPVDLMICREVMALINEARERFRKEYELEKGLRSIENSGGKASNENSNR